MENNKPLGMIGYEELYNILKALALTDCDKRTLGIVAEATGLGDYWPKPVEVERPVYLLERGQ